jgi:unsaturated chondroitin disaccharide hydrolase
MKKDNWIHQALEYSLSHLRQNLASLDAFPEFTENNHWRTVENGGWVGGHWVGLLWLAFGYTHAEDWKLAARDWAARLAPRCFDTTTHDLGFLFSLSHLSGYKLTGEESFRVVALQAAETWIPPGVGSSRCPL